MKSFLIYSGLFGVICGYIWAGIWQHQQLVKKAQELGGWIEREPYVSGSNGDVYTYYHEYIRLPNGRRVDD
jgi:hypothetical protein